MEKDLYKDLALELEAKQKQLNEKDATIARLKQVIEENDLEDEIEGIDCTSVEEQICVNGIQHIAQLVEAQEFDDKDIKNFDVLLKNLRMIRGLSSGDNKAKKSKPADVKDLLKIVKGED